MASGSTSSSQNGELQGQIALTPPSLAIIGPPRPVLSEMPAEILREIVKCYLDGFPLVGVPVHRADDPPRPPGSPRGRTNMLLISRTFHEMARHTIYDKISLSFKYSDTLENLGLHLGAGANFSNVRHVDISPWMLKTLKWEEIPTLFPQLQVFKVRSVFIVGPREKRADGFRHREPEPHRLWQSAWWEHFDKDGNAKIGVNILEYYREAIRAMKKQGFGLNIPLPDLVNTTNPLYFSHVQGFFRDYWPAVVILCQINRIEPFHMHPSDNRVFFWSSGNSDPESNFAVGFAEWRSEPDNIPLSYLRPENVQPFKDLIAKCETPIKDATIQLCVHIYDPLSTRPMEPSQRHTREWDLFRNWFADEPLPAPVEIIEEEY